MRMPLPYVMLINHVTNNNYMAQKHAYAIALRDAYKSRD